MPILYGPISTVCLSLPISVSVCVSDGSAVLDTENMNPDDMVKSGRKCSADIEENLSSVERHNSYNPNHYQDDTVSASHVDTLALYKSLTYLHIVQHSMHVQQMIRVNGYRHVKSSVGLVSESSWLQFSVNVMADVCLEKHV